MKTNNNKLIFILLFSFLISIFSYLFYIYTLESNRFVYTGYGANETIGGSMHLITIGNENILLDAGSFYTEEEKKKMVFPSNLIQKLDGIIITHAHTDHIGRLIDLVNQGYRKPIYATKPTIDLIKIVIPSNIHDADAESDALTTNGNDLNSSDLNELQIERNLVKKNWPILESLLVEIPLHKKTEIGKHFTFTLYNTPHISGSAMIYLENRVTHEKLLYTGDLGNSLNPLLLKQEYLVDVDYLIIEGTYGIKPLNQSWMDRLEFQKYIGKELNKGKRVIIPSYALEQTQQVLTEIANGINNQLIPRTTDVYVLGTTANKINELYKKRFSNWLYQSYFNENYSKLILPLDYIPIQYITSAPVGSIVIIPVDWKNSNTLYQALKVYIGDASNSFFFIQANHNDRLYDALYLKQKSVVLSNKKYTIYSKSFVFQCFKAHGSYEEMKAIIKPMKNLKRIYIVHSSKDNSMYLQNKYSYDFKDKTVYVPKYKQKMIIK